MADAPEEADEPQSESLHFQFFILATVLFLVAIFWCTDLDYRGAFEARAAAASEAAVLGLRVIAGYLALTFAICGHKFLRNNHA